MSVLEPARDPTTIAGVPRGNGVAEDPAPHLARLCALVLMFGAGLLTVVNSEFSQLRSVNVDALRTTGLVTMLAALVFLYCCVPRSSQQRKGTGERCCRRARMLM